MALPLVDARIKVTMHTDAVIELEHRKTGKDKSEIAREVLHAWAMGRFDDLRLLKTIMDSKGLRGELEGAPGIAQEEGAGFTSIAGEGYDK